MPHKDEKIKKEYHKNYYLNQRLNSEKDALNKFLNVTTSNSDPKYLTTKGYNEISDISVIATVRLLKTSWCLLLREHNLIDKLYNYIKDEFLNYYLITDDSVVSNFIDNHKYITQDLFKYFGIKQFKRDCGFSFSKYSNGKLAENFNYVKSLIGHLPTHIEFKENSTIIPDMYYKTFGTDWDKIVRMYALNEDEMNEYFLLMNMRNIKQGKVASKKRVELYGLSLDELEIEFKNVYNDSYERFGVYPSRRYFNKVSKFSDLAYRKRFKTSWTKISEMYGYQYVSKFLSEKIVLESIKSIVKIDYISQKSWKWLIGVGGGYMYCDGYFPDLNLVIEFDGEQHRVPNNKFGGIEKFIRTLENDELKTKLLKENNINLIRIPSNKPWHDINYLVGLLSLNNIQLPNQPLSSSTG